MKNGSWSPDTYEKWKQGQVISMINLQGGFFFTGPALKVLSVEDGKIPTKKVKVHGKFLCDTFASIYIKLPSFT